MHKYALYAEGVRRYTRNRTHNTILHLQSHLISVPMPFIHVRYVSIEICIQRAQRKVAEQGTYATRTCLKQESCCHPPKYG
jgi:hypothetical protein